MDDVVNELREMELYPDEVIRPRVRRAITRIEADAARLRELEEMVREAREVLETYACKCKPETRETECTEVEPWECGFRARALLARMGERDDRA